MGKFDGVLDEVYGKQNTKLTSVLDEIYGPKVEPITMIENEPTPIADMMVGLNRSIESAGEAITSPIRKLFTAPPNQDVIVPEELDLGSMQTVRDRQAMLPPSMPAEPGYVPPAGITEGLEAALPIAYQATKKGISGALQAAAENLPITSFPTEPVSKYMQEVGSGAQGEIEKIIKEKQIRPGTAGAVATDVASSMAQFLPIAGMSIISPSVAPAGLAFLATVSGGDKYQRAKEAGFGEGEALAQGIAYGAAEAIGEKIGLDYLLAAAKNPAVMSGVKTIFAQGLKQAGVEGAEEGLTQIIQNATDIVAKKARPETKGEAPTILQDVPYAMGVGAIAGGLTGGGLGALQSIMTGQQQPQPEAPKEEVQPEEPTATEPAPQNMEATTEFLTRKPAVTIGEAERLRGEEVPTGGMTINRQAKPTVTFGGEGERTGEAIPEGKGMTIQPTTPSNKLDQLFKREPATPQEPKAKINIEELKKNPIAVFDPETYENGSYKNIPNVRIVDYKTSSENISKVFGNAPVVLKNINESRSDRMAIVTKSPKKGVGYQVTVFDKNGPLYDDAYQTRNEAIERAIREEFEIPAKMEDFDKLTSNTDWTRHAPTHSKVQPSSNAIIEPSTPSPEPQQATEVAPKDITPQPAEPTAVKTPEIETTPEIGDTIQWNTPKVLGKTQTKTGTIVDKTADNRWTISIDGQEFDFNPQKNTNIKVVEKYQQPTKTEQEQYVETRRAEISKEQKAKEEARQKEMQDLQSSIKTPDVKESEIFTDEEIAKKKTYIQRLNDEFEQKQKENKERAAKRIPVKSFEYGDKPTENKYYRILMANENIDAKEGFEIVEDAKPFKVKDVDGDYFIVKEQNTDYKKRSIHARFPKSKMLYSVSDAETGYKILSVPTVKEATEKLKEIFDSGKLRKTIGEMIKSKGRSPRYLQPRPKTGPGMFGGAQLQNAYEKVEPTLKKGADMLFKKGKQAYETVKRNADLTRDMGRVVDITEKEGRPVETEPPIRPRIGLFNLQNVYDALTRPMKRRAEDKRFKEHLDRTMAAGPRQRIEEARGIDKLSFMDKARKAITRAKELATRKFPDLDEKQFPEFANKLRVLDGGKDYADGMAGYIVGETIKDLSPEEYNVFGTSLILDDLQKGLDTGLYTNDLPFGYDAQSLAADRQAIDPTELRRAGFNDKADRIEEAIRKRNDFMREVKQEAVDNGLLPETVMNDDRYFHHQVLQYMNMQDEAKNGVKKDVRLGKKGYRMSRTGSLLDFNSEYAQAEFEVLSQMIEDNKFAEFLKYVESLDITPNLRAQAQAQGLPTDAKTLKELIPPTYVEWQPAKGNNFYKVFTIPERIVEEIIAKGDAVDVSMDDINEALAVGGPKKTLVIPEGLVKTLDNFKAPRNDGALGKLGNAINKIWKTSMLFMPSRVTNYMLTNAFGDTDVVLAYQPKILGELPSAIKELKANDRKNNKDLEKAYKEQVIGANITEKEIQNIDYESINKPFNIMRYLKNPLNIGKDYLQRAVRINAFRENALRYAAYKYFLSELRAGKKNIYAASDRTKIDGITDMEEKAATLARDLMGDYGNVSALGEEIARKIIPFYRWMEINTPRYYRLLKNASNEGGYEGAIKGGYKRLKRFVQMNIVGTILYQLYHAAIGAVSGDDELEKARDVTRARGQLHSLLLNWLIGDDKKDIVRTVRTQGAWSDVTETLIGTSDLFSDVMDVATGKTKFKDKMKELGWKLDNPADFFNIPPIRKYSMAALPLARTAAEVLTGRASTRSIMETRPIRDRMQHFAKAMALGAPYNLAADKPGPERGISDLVTYKTNLGEVAYNEITRKKYEFLRERGYPLPSASESPSGTAYYNLKQAVKFGDKKQIRKYFKEYNQERRKLGKDTADWYDVKERIKESADPSSFMKEELWDEFRKTLNNEEKRKLKTAMRWFKETYK